jgi:sporulation protein YlmC with PRC-barrel domain
MPGLDEVRTWRGRDVIDPDGAKVGTIEDLYLDRRSGAPEWAAVRVGLFGSSVSLVLLEDASSDGDDIRVAFDEATIAAAPALDRDDALTEEEERRLYQHYGRRFGDPPEPAPVADEPIVSGGDAVMRNDDRSDRS